MSTISKQLALTEATPGMILSGDLLDPQGQVLLPKGTTLTEKMIASLARHDVVSLRILAGELTEEEEAVQRAYFQLRLKRLFRQLGDGEADQALHTYICNFRLENNHDD